MKNAKITFISLVLALSAYAPNALAQATPLSACGNITSSGSYQLKNNLTSTGDCLKILVNDVSIDLNGFTISGAHTGAAITDLSAARSVLAVSHGILYNFKTGINLAKSGTIEVEDVRAVNMVGDGIDGGQHTVVSGTQSVGNGGKGISLGADSTVTGSTANNNTGGAGISMGVQARVTGNTANNNGTDGIVTSDRSLVSQNQTSNNKSDGISVGFATTVSGNTAVQNGLRGIDAAGHDLIEGNVTNNNTTGIFGDGGGSLISNLAFGNKKNGIDNGTAKEATLINNNASGNLGTGITVTCPSNLVANTALGKGTDYSPLLANLKTLGCGDNNNL